MPMASADDGPNAIQIRARSSHGKAGQISGRARNQNENEIE